MAEYLLEFHKIGKGDVAVAGGKGANLGEMARAGFPIPPGAVVTAQAYERFLSENAIDPWEWMSGKAEGSVNDAAAGLRAAILRGEIPGDVREQVLAFYDRLGETARVAVRSSATAEDLEDASFAGQQETYLNVIGREELLRKIKECYASLWGDRAVSYRRKQGYDQGTVALAVVIQQMVESESAGVTFTVNPAGDEDTVLINASYGLGEAVVSGLVSPDEYVRDRKGGMTSVSIGSKEQEILYAEKGTVKKEVSAERRATRVLTDAQIEELTKEALRIEEHYGHPMDVEWAFAGGKLYILQARAITTIGRKERRTFTEEDFAGLPKPGPAKGALRETMLFNLEKTPTAYYPLDHDFAGCIAKQKAILFAEAGIKVQGDFQELNDDGITLVAKYGMKPTKKIVGIVGYLKKILDHENNRRMADQSLKDCRQRFENEKNADPQELADIGKALERLAGLVADTAYGRFKYALFPSALVTKKLSGILKKVDPELNAYDLLEGLEYVTANVNRRMGEMAACIRQNDTTLKLVMEEKYATIIAKDSTLKERFEGFLAEYGSKSDFNCYCFIARSWVEDPDRFLQVLRPMIRSKGQETLSLEEGKKRHEQLLARIREKIGDGKFRKVEPKIQAFRYYHYVREISQYLWESEFLYCRELLGRCARLLGRDKEDLYYLFADELFEVCRSGAISDDMLKKLERRKEKRPLAEAYWDKCMIEALDTGDDQIKGISGSAGTAKGKVCVVGGPKEFWKLQQGDVLVCTYTDPEWTPLFGLAAAVVVDTGGSLSHAAIVAREYGIPAVLATGNATRRLKDGDFVIVNGSAGSVSRA